MQEIQTRGEKSTSSGEAASQGACLLGRKNWGRKGERGIEIIACRRNHEQDFIMSNDIFGIHGNHQVLSQHITLQMRTHPFYKVEETRNYDSYHLKCLSKSRKACHPQEQKVSS